MCLFCVLICTVRGPLSALLFFSPVMTAVPENISSRLKHMGLAAETYCGKVMDKHLKDGNTRAQIPFIAVSLSIFFFLEYVQC